MISVIAPLDQRRGGGIFQAPLDGLATPFRGSGRSCAETSAATLPFYGFVGSKGSDRVAGGIQGVSFLKLSGLWAKERTLTV